MSRNIYCATSVIIIIRMNVSPATTATRMGHTANFCRGLATTAANHGTSTIMGNSGGMSCFECGDVGHFNRDCPKLKNQEGNAYRRGFLIGARDAIRDPSMVTGMFLINNLYATIHFGSGADKSFITPKFRQLLNHESTKLKKQMK